MTKGKGMKSTARFLRTIIPVLASCISLLFLCNDTNAQITSEELVFIKSGIGDDALFFTFYERESIEVNGDTVYVNTIDTMYRGFTWEDAEQYGIWVNPELVVDGRYHLSSVTMNRYRIFCSERVYRREYGHLTALWTPGDIASSMDVTSYNASAQQRYIDAVETYNSTRSWPVRSESDMSRWPTKMDLSINSDASFVADNFCP
jgi:hypothetical protein